MSNSTFAPLTHTAIEVSETEEGAYIDGYESGEENGFADGYLEGQTEGRAEGYGDGNENGYTEGWYDARALAEKEQAVLEARIELLEFQLSAMERV